jgi:hypothetical protein
MLPSELHDVLAEMVSGYRFACFNILGKASFRAGNCRGDTHGFAVLAGHVSARSSFVSAQRAAASAILGGLYFPPQEPSRQHRGLQAH